MTTEIETTPAINTNLSGCNVMLMGPAGTGKTHSIGTLVESGLEVFYLALEPGLESLLGYFSDKGNAIPPNLHWATVKAPQASFTELIDSATKINTLTFESITKMQDPNRSKHNQFISLLQALNNFTDERTGESFGPVNLWDQTRVLVLDSLTGLNAAAMSLVIGGKPVKNMADWAVAQDQVEKILSLLCNNCACHFVLIAHVQRETDQVLGGVKLMVDTLGKALAPKLPRMFSDVILTVRQADKWSWDTASSMADVKTRNLKVSSNIEPDFRQIVAKWKVRSAA